MKAAGGCPDDIVMPAWVPHVWHDLPITEWVLWTFLVFPNAAEVYWLDEYQRSCGHRT